MSLRTRLYAKLMIAGKAGASRAFERLPPVGDQHAVKTAPMAEIWGLRATDLVVATGLPSWDAHPFRENAGVSVVKGLQRLLPNDERWTRWGSRAAADHELAEVLGAVGRGQTFTPWPDYATDAAFARALVQGPMAPLLEHRGDEFVVDCRILAGLERHPGTVPLGVVVVLAFRADATGARTPQLVRIELEDGTVRTPADGEAWQIAKLIAAAGMQTWLVVGPHLVYTHFLNAGALATAAVSELPNDHAVRRLLTPHIAGTLRVNDRAGKTLLGPHGNVQAVYSFPWPSVQQLIARAIAQYDPTRFDLPMDLERRGLTDLCASGDYPYGADALLIWNALHVYVREYLCVYYPTDADLSADSHIQRFVATFCRSSPGLRADSLTDLARALTARIFAVTVHHKLVGGISLEFLTHPYFLPHRVGPGERVDDVVPFREQTEANLAAKFGTTYRSWGLTADWPSVALDENGRAVMQAFQDELRAISEHIDARNSRRAVPFPHLRPTELESSVAV